MTTLIELAGPYPQSLPEKVGYANLVTEWSMGGNQKFSDCSFVALANLHDLVSAVNGRPEVISEAECEFFYAVETGFDPNNPSTDKGAVLGTLLSHWMADGWPGDSELRPIGYCELREDEIPVCIYLLGGAVAWAMLPSDGAGGYDFSGTDKPGEYAHAVFIAQATSDSLTLITWARREVVSREWWAKYGREVFGLLHPQWTVPREAVIA